MLGQSAHQPFFGEEKVKKRLVSAPVIKIVIQMLKALTDDFKLQVFIFICRKIAKAQDRVLQIDEAEHLFKLLECAFPNIVLVHDCERIIHLQDVLGECRRDCAFAL